MQALASLTDHRILLHPFFAAVTAVLENLLRHPDSHESPSDLQIVQPFLRLLEILAGNERICSQSDESRRMYQVCQGLNERANAAIECAGRNATLVRLQ